MSEAVNKIETKEGKKTTFDVVEHPEFPGDMKTAILTSIDMANIISNMFAGVMPDYYGCRVRVNYGNVPVVNNTMPGGALYVDLFFKDQCTEEDKKNIIPRNSQSNNNRGDLAARFARVNGANNGRVYTVTKQTYEMLEEFMRTGPRTRWMDHTFESASPMGPYGKDEVVVCITGLDLDRIITKIYGNKDQNSRYEYQAKAASILPNKNNEFIMTVTKLDLSAVRDLQESLGIFNNAQMNFHVYNG